MADTASLGELIGSLAGAIAPAPSSHRAAAPPPAVTPRRVPSPKPDREIEIRLRSGRRVRARIAPAIARRDDLAAVASAAAANDRQAFDALRSHREAIADLQRSCDELAKRVETLERRAA